MKCFFMLLLATNCFAGYSQQVAGHPFLLVTKTNLQNIKKSIATNALKQKSWLLLKSKADIFLNEKIEIPPRGGNWEHYYVSPKTGNELVRGKQTGDFKWEHYDALTKEQFTSDTSNIKNDYDGVVISLLHDSWAIGALELGLAYQITNDKKYAIKAKDILLDYAALYPLLVEKNLFDDNTQKASTGKGRVHVQNLNEALWLIDIVQSADLIWNTLTQKEKNKIKNNIFYPAITLINEDKNKISNIQCWKNAATGMVGFFMDDQKLIDRAMLDSTEGYFAQLDKGVTKEGFWMDRSPSYHFYALNAMVLLSQAAHNYGYPISFEPLKKMFTSPLLLANAGFYLPPYNDSKTVHLPAEAYLYEWGYSQFKDERFLNIINNNYRGNFKNIGPTFTGWALLFGQDSLAHPQNWERKSANLLYTGIGLLSKGQQKDNLSVYLKYNSTTFSHRHNDELSLAISKGFGDVLVTPGVVSYGSFLTPSWYRTTLAHNSFTVNNSNQSRKSRGKCLAFGKESDIDYIITRTSNAYDSLKFTRTAALLNENVVIIIDQFVSQKKKPQQLDIIYHPAGKWQNQTKENSWNAPQNIPGYNMITDANITSETTGSILSTSLQSGKTMLMNTTSSGLMDVITGYGIPYRGHKLPIAIYRINRNEGALVTCISLGGQPIKMSLETVKDENGSPIIQSSIIKLILQYQDGKKIAVITNPQQLNYTDNEILIKDTFKIATYLQ